MLDIRVDDLDPTAEATFKNRLSDLRDADWQGLLATSQDLFVIPTTCPRGSIASQGANPSPEVIRHGCGSLAAFAMPNGTATMQSACSPSAYPWSQSNAQQERTGHTKINVCNRASHRQVVSKLTGLPILSNKAERLPSSDIQRKT